MIRVTEVSHTRNLISMDMKIKRVVWRWVPSPPARSVFLAPDRDFWGHAVMLIYIFQSWLLVLLARKWANFFLDHPAGLPWVARASCWLLVWARFPHTCISSSAPSCDRYASIFHGFFLLIVNALLECSSGTGGPMHHFKSPFDRGGRKAYDRESPSWTHRAAQIWAIGFRVWYQYFVYS